jgi:general secretion pathway protein A
MYKSYYGLKEKPFELSPDPDYLYMSRGHENVYDHLEYALTEHKGFVVITGEIGSGKTTLINLLLRRLARKVCVGLINHTSVAPLQFLKMICREFDLPVRTLNKTQVLLRFQEFLLARFSEGKRVVLIVDEAQNLPPRTMEELRMLSNLETEKHHLLQIILVGQPELRALLDSRRLEQFAQRVTVSCHLDRLSRREVKQYIDQRLRVAGAERQNLFTEEAIEAIYRCSEGTPRLINALCDGALVYGFADEAPTIDRGIVEEVGNDRRMKLSENPSSIKPESGKVHRRLVKRMGELERRLRSIERSVSRLHHILHGSPTGSASLRIHGLLKGGQQEAGGEHRNAPSIAFRTD